MSENVKVLIVIPVYNHGKTLRDVVIRALQTGAEVMVVDDGSTDGGLGTLPGLKINVVRHSENRGKGAAILTAVKEAEKLGKTHIVTIDADGQHDPEDFSRFLPLIQENSLAIIVGTRIFDKKASPRLSRFGRSFSNFWFRVQTSGSLKDTQSGFRAYPVAVLSWLKLHDKRFSFEVEVLVKAAWAGIEIKEVDIAVHYLPPRERISHFHLVKDNLALSLLHTKLTMRAVLPLPHKRFIPSKEGLENISIFHPMKSLRILSKNTSPTRLAVSAGMGVLIGTLPLVGFWTITVLFTANYFGLSKMTALGSNQFCNHPIVPALCIELGYFFRHGRFLTEFSLNTLGYQGLERIFEWLIGSLVLAPVFGLISGGLIYILAWSITRGKGIARESQRLYFKKRLNRGRIYVNLELEGIKLKEGFLMTIKEKLKKMIVEELNLEEIQPEEIEDEAPLFGEGLGLDSLDAVELVVLVEKYFGVEIKNLDKGRIAFQSINSLAAFIEERNQP